MVPITFENLFNLAVFILFAPVQPLVYVITFFLLPALFPGAANP